MPFSPEQAVPILMRKEIEWAEKNFPAIPEKIPDVVAERTRYIYHTVGIEESYWPARLKNP